MSICLHHLVNTVCLSYITHIVSASALYPYSSEIVYECPDYHTSGKNSCFFSKNDTSIWVNYNITVVATNSLGSNFSDSVDVDVMYIGELCVDQCFTFCGIHYLFLR